LLPIGSRHHTGANRQARQTARRLPPHAPPAANISRATQKGPRGVQ